MDIRIIATSFDPQVEEAAFAARRTDRGALVSFVGLCRARTDGHAVDALFLDHYPGFTEKEIARFSADVAARCECPDILVVHRVGRILPGESIVLVAAMSEHRNAAFETVRLLMDYLKTDAPFWKKEIGPDGERWIEPSAEDLFRRAQAERQTL